MCKKNVFMLILVSLFTHCIPAFSKDAETDFKHESIKAVKTNADWNYAFEPVFGITYGEHYEYIYSSVTGNRVSCLQWDEKPLYKTGFNFYAEYNKLSFCFGLVYDLPLACGIMQDSDYTAGSGLKYNYSVHENSCYGGVNFFLKTKYNISQEEHFFLEPVLELSYEYLKFRGHDGYGWYGSSNWTSDGNTHSWDSEYAHYFPDGKYHLGEIGYEINDFYFYTGMSLQWETGSRIKFGAEGVIAPYSFVCNYDTHFGKDSENKQMHYIKYYFNRYRVNAFFSFDFSSRFSMLIFTSSSYTPEQKARFYVQDDDTGDWFKHPQNCGYSSFSHTARIGVKYNF